MDPDRSAPDGPTATVSWAELIDDVTRRLAPLNLPAPASEARWLVESVAGLEGGELYVERHRPAPWLGVTRLDRLVARRLVGEPIQYVLGRWGFRTLDLFVDPRVLIPRAETEVVVDHALAAVDRAATNPPDRTTPVRVADLGTGSGAIALALAVERAMVDVWASDVSADALAVARANLAGIGRPAQRVRMVEGSWFDALPLDLQGSIDVIVSNPPYIADVEQLPDEVTDWEPAEALRSGPSGLEAIECLVERSVEWLAPRGSLVVEIASHQRADALALAERAGLDATVAADLAGRDRVLVVRRRNGDGGSAGGRPR